MPMAPAFTRYIGIDYSGAQTPQACLKEFRVYCADGAAAAQEVLPSPIPRKYWTRRGIAEWLADRLAEDAPTIVGIDHDFLFRCAISKCTSWSRTGLRSWRTSSATGPQTPTIPTSISCATAWLATAQRVAVTLAGAAKTSFEKKCMKDAVGEAPAK